MWAGRLPLLDLKQSLVFRVNNAWRNFSWYLKKKQHLLSTYKNLHIERTVCEESSQVITLGHKKAMHDWKCFKGKELHLQDLALCERMTVTVLEMRHSWEHLLSSAQKNVFANFNFHKGVQGRWHVMFPLSFPWVPLGRGFSKKDLVCHALLCSIAKLWFHSAPCHLVRDVWVVRL